MKRKREAHWRPTPSDDERDRVWDLKVILAFAEGKISGQQLDEYLYIRGYLPESGKS